MPQIFCALISLQSRAQESLVRTFTKNSLYMPSELIQCSFWLRIDLLRRLNWSRSTFQDSIPNAGQLCVLLCYHCSLSSTWPRVSTWKQSSWYRKVSSKQRHLYLWISQASQSCAMPKTWQSFSARSTSSKNKTDHSCWHPATEMQ